MIDKDYGAGIFRLPSGLIFAILLYKIAMGNACYEWRAVSGKVDIRGKVIIYTQLRAKCLCG